MRKINIAIDGYAGCGKSTTAELVAEKLNYIFVDTGSMYRAFTLFLLRNNIAYQDYAAVEGAIPLAQISFRLNPGTHRRETLLNGENVEGHIRSLEVSAIVSEVSAIRPVRRLMVEQQRQLGLNRGVVMDGRDIGTVVFPDAELKVFMTASLAARIARRSEELQRLGMQVNLQELEENLKHRDYLDTTRQESPLRRAQDARPLDTTHLTVQAQAETVLTWAQELIGAHETSM